MPVGSQKLSIFLICFGGGPTPFLSVDFVNILPKIKKRGWTDINFHKSAHKILRSWHELLLLHDLSASTDQEKSYPMP